MNYNDLPEGWFTKKDIEVYRALVSQLPVNAVLVELGTWKGRSLCSIADLIREKCLIVHAIDTFEGTANEGDAHKEAQQIDLQAEFEANLTRFDIRDHVKVIKSTTLDAAKVYDHKANMIFIDADHSTEAVLADIKAWQPHLIEGGILSGHDWVWESVRQAITMANLDVNHCGNLWFNCDLYPYRSFSVCFIARNEAKCLPRALASLEEFRAQGGEVCLVDTGSTDDTAQIARDWGCKVKEVGDKFKISIDEELAKNINDKFTVEGEEPVVKAGETLFDFGNARNESANMSSNEMVMWMDGDEAVTKMDLAKINRLVKNGADQFEYNFVFSHDQNGNPDVEFIQSKFYNKNKLFWKGIIHEVISVINEAESDLIEPVVRLDQSVYKLEHWQNYETNRSGYLKGLAVDCFLHPTSDRNSHYFAREMGWNGRPKSAIKEFKRHLEISWWPAERGQSMIFAGDAYAQIGEEAQAKEWFLKGYEEEPRRREALMRLAEMAFKKNDYQRCASYCAAALEIAWDGFYANVKSHYTHMPHELMYWAKWYLGDIEGSRAHFDKALSYQPESGKFLHDYRFYYNLPMVSFVIPHLSLGIKEREEGLQKCLDSIKALNYPQDKIEIIVENDEPRMGVPKRVKSMTDRAKGEFIVYASNDVIFSTDSLIQAIVMINRDGLDLCSFNTGELLPDLGNRNEHFIIRKSFVDDFLNGEVFDVRYRHLSVDNILWARVSKWGKADRCELARVAHNHFSTTGISDAVYDLAWNQDNIEHDRALLREDLDKLYAE